MGRKLKGFVKASAKPPEEEQAEPAPAPPPPAEEKQEAPTAPKAASSSSSKPSKSSKSSSSSAAAAPVASAPPTPVKSEDPGSGDDSDGSGDGGAETKGKMLQRHKREMLAFKKTLQHAGKKSKDEVAKLTAQIEKRHAEELKNVGAGGGGGDAAAAAPTAAKGSSSSAAKGAAAGGGGGGDAAAAADPLSKYLKGLMVDSTEAAAQSKRPTKAQKRREKHAAKDAERDARIAAEKEALGTPERLQEEAELRALLAPLGLGIKEIRADGHCMYRSVEDQLRSTAKGPAKTARVKFAVAEEEEDSSDSDDGPDDGVPGYQELRELAAAHIRAHREEFAPYLVPDDEGQDAAAYFDKYCDDIEMTATWGSHVELTALAAALGRKIVVYGVGMAPQEVGAGGDGPPLALCFLRFALGLGDHFNSTKALLIPPGGGEEGAEEEEEE